MQILNGKICEPCNQVLGREVDQEFTRVGPEAILRTGMGIAGRHGEPKSPYYFRAATTHPLRAIHKDAREDETGLLWETVLGESGQPEGRLLQQLVVLDGSRKRRSVPINIDWPAEVLRGAVAHRGLAGGTPIELYLDPKHLDRFKPILSEVFPRFRVQHFARSGAGQQRRTLLFVNRIGPEYFRAIAKIAFHGTLRVLPELVGDEWELNVIRRFVRYGDLPTINPVQISDRPIVAGIGKEFMFRDWGHLVTVETTHTAVFAKLQFFIGPDAVPPTWLVRVGRRPETVTADFVVGYYARYLPEPSIDGHTGEMIELEAKRSEEERSTP